MDSIGFIGGGNMAEAIIKGIVTGGLYSESQILVGDVKDERLACLADTYGVAVTTDNAHVAAGSDVLVLAVKPQMLTDAAVGIREHIRPDAVIVSIIAGRRVLDIEALLGQRAIVRVMPNTPALIGEGAAVLYANERGRTCLDKVRRIFECVGLALTVEDERLIDAVTAVSGSGPAYFFLLMQEMIQAGTSLGLTPHVARRLVLQTAKGAALLAVVADGQGQSPADLSARVATPGGTTEAALNVFHAGGFERLVNEALTAACKRSGELSGRGVVKG